jgi:GNAT superfamily N-acetyltransferase
MCDEWMPTLRLPLTPEQFHKLPRHPAYRYEYLDGQARLSPCSRFYHAQLDLLAHQGPGLDGAEEAVAIRPARADDFAALEPVFAAAFLHAQPFEGLDETTRLQAARACLGRTRDGGDGPWIEQASFVADRAEDGRPVGAIFVTLLPPGDPCDPESYSWREPPPADAIGRRLGQPHLTWIFVTPLTAGRGVGTALLATAVHALLRLGFTRLLTTFLLGNASSMLWHWRNGFELLAYPDSGRLLRERWRQERR